nr:replication protein [Cloning vector pSv42]
MWGCRSSACTCTYAHVQRSKFFQIFRLRHPHIFTPFCFLVGLIAEVTCAFIGYPRCIC